VKRRFVDEAEYESVLVEHLAQLLVSEYRRQGHSRKDERPAANCSRESGRNDRESGARDHAHDSRHRPSA
jgi:hypothetical protein